MDEYKILEGIHNYSISDREIKLLIDLVKEDLETNKDVIDSSVNRYGGTIAMALVDAVCNRFC
jgi:hypothetical protein